MTLEAAAARFEDLLRSRGYERRTVQGYHNALAGFVAFLGECHLREATRTDVAAHLCALEREGFHPKTVGDRLIRLRCLFDFLVGEGLLLVNPAATLRRRSSPHELRAWLSEEEVGKLLAVPRTSRSFELRNRAILEVLYSTGLRVGELVRLELEDLDLAEGFVTVKKSKNGEGRAVPMGGEAVRWLSRYLDEVRRRHVEKRHGRDRTQVVFLRGTGRPMEIGDVADSVGLHARRAGIEKKVTPHVLRHTFAVHLLKHGAPSRYIQAMLGHRSLQSTQVYTRLLPADLLAAHRRAHPSEQPPK